MDVSSYLITKINFTEISCESDRTVAKVWNSRQAGAAILTGVVYHLTSGVHAQVAIDALVKGVWAIHNPVARFFWYVTPKNVGATPNGINRKFEIGAH